MILVSENYVARNIGGIPTTKALIGNVGDVMRVIMSFEERAAIYTAGTNPSFIFVENVLEIVEAETNVSIADSGIAVGMRIKFKDNANTEFELGIVSSISGNKIVFDRRFPDILLTAKEYSNAVGIYVQELTSANLNFNLIENSASTTFASLLNDITLELKFEDLTSAYKSFELANNIGSQPILDAVLRIEDENLNPTVANPYFQRFQLRVDFIISPLYDTFGDTANNVLPNYFRGSNCLKAVIQAKGLHFADDPNSGSFFTYDTRIGNTGFYNEILNGGNNGYQVDLISIENSFGANEIVVNEVNTVTVRIVGSGATTSGYVSEFFFTENIDPDYDNDFVDVFKFNNRELQGSSDVVMNRESLTQINPTTLELVFTISPNVDVSNYVLGVIVAKNMDFDFRSSNIFKIGRLQDLVLDDSVQIDAKVELQNIDTQIDQLATYVGDNVVGVTTITVDKITNTILDNIEIGVGVVNNGVRYPLDIRNFDLTTGILSQNNAYILDIDESVGFSDTNKDLIQLTLFSDSLTTAVYKLRFPIITRFDSWNPASLPVPFYNKNQPLNGFNQNWGRLEDVDDSRVVFYCKTSSNNGSQNSNVALNVRNFGEDPTNTYTDAVVTFKNSQGQIISAISRTEDTIVEVLFTLANDIDVNDYYGDLIIASNNSGLPTLIERTGTYLSNHNSPMLPEIMTKSQPSSNQIRLFTRIRGANVPEGIEFAIYPRLALGATEPIQPVDVFFDTNSQGDPAISMRIVTREKASNQPVVDYGDGSPTEKGDSTNYFYIHEYSIAGVKGVKAAFPNALDVQDMFFTDCKIVGELDLSDFIFGTTITEVGGGDYNNDYNNDYAINTSEESFFGTSFVSIIRSDDFTNIVLNQGAYLARLWITETGITEYISPMTKGGTNYVFRDNPNLTTFDITAPDSVPIPNYISESDIEILRCSSLTTVNAPKRGGIGLIDKVTIEDCPNIVDLNFPHSNEISVKNINGRLFANRIGSTKKGIMSLDNIDNVRGVYGTFGNTLGIDSITINNCRLVSDNVFFYLLNSSSGNNNLSDGITINYTNNNSGSSVPVLAINQALLEIDQRGVLNGTFDGTGSGSPDSNTPALVAALEAKGWTITLDA